MQRSKAEQHAIDGSKLELLRAGETRCVVPRIVGPGPDTITLRLDACA